MILALKPQGSNVLCSEYTKRDMEYQEFSNIVSLALDSMGFSYDTVRQRQLLNEGMFDEMFRSFSDNEEDMFILVGSTAEGIHHVWSEGTDIDIMGVTTNLMISDGKPTDTFCNNDEILLQMACENVAPGYTMLKFDGANRINALNIIKNKYDGIIDVVEKDGGYYLTYDLRKALFEVIPTFKNNLLREDKCDGKDMHEISGPALTYKPFEKPFKTKFDSVLAIPFVFKSHIQNWINRPKHYGWPTKELISKTKNQIGYVVPVGSKCSENTELEWRICYTEIELMLVRSLNETQIKLYVLLKMIAKRKLTLICKDISSYVMKNLVLWIVERNSNEIFTPENITSLVMLALRSLRNKVDMRFFPNYMIPERNLFAGRITEPEKTELVNKLDEMLAQGPGFLVSFAELQEIQKAVDDVINDPFRIEMKIKLWHLYSLVSIYDLENTELETICMKIIAGTILVTEDFVLDVFQKTKVRDIFLATEITEQDVQANLEALEEIYETEEKLFSIVLSFLGHG